MFGYLYISSFLIIYMFMISKPLLSIKIFLKVFVQWHSTYKILLSINYYIISSSLLLTLVSQLSSIVSRIDISGIWIGACLYLLQKYMISDCHMITLPFERFQLLSWLSNHLWFASLFLFVLFFSLWQLQQLLRRKP